MSGHSHAKTIKHKKEVTDKKRGQIFSKLARLITIAVKEHGPNPERNSKLRMAIETARSFNMPKDNVERAIQRGTGELSEENLEEFLFEAYGPGGIAVIVEGITDNRNRTLGEFKQILSQNNGKIATEGSVKWMFERKGVIVINPESQDASPKKEDIELKAIEAGAEDLFWHVELLDVYTKPEELEKTRKNLKEKNIKIESASLDWIAKEMIQLSEKDREAAEKLFAALDENDAVQEIYSNLKI